MRLRPRAQGIPLADAPAALEDLLEVILAFWDERVIDRDGKGGYRLGHDVYGRATGSPNRHLISQTRTAWFFARLARSPYGEERHLEWAAHGIRLLEDRMWDREHGGFFWALDDDRKHLCGQGYGVYALNEYARAADDSSARARAVELAELMDRHGRDERYGGYIECLQRDWSPEPPDRTSLLGVPARLKTINTHLHLLEAFTDLPPSEGRERVRHLVELLPTLEYEGTLLTTWERNWEPNLDHGDFSSYGHDVEAAWMLMRGCEAVEMPIDALDPLYTVLWDNALSHGFDSRHGGMFEKGPIGRRADRAPKVWWVQAETILGAMYMWRRTGDDRYRDAFERTLAWVVEFQADRDAGDWHAEVDSRRRASGAKSGPWSDPYHQGRAVLDCLELLAAG